MIKLNYVKLFLLSTILFLLVPNTLFGENRIYSTLSDNQYLINKRVTEFTKSILEKIVSTRYQHEPEIFDEENGIFITNCSGLTNYILKNVHREAYDALEVEEQWCWESKPRPRAAAYYKAFIDGELFEGNPHTYWKRILNTLDAEAGDFLAWQENSYNGNTNSGHVLIIMEKPILIEDDTVLIEVIDASKYPHSNDTRKPGSGGGVGRGIMRLQIDENGSPKGYYWSLKSPEAKIREIAIGRLKPRGI